MIQHAFAWFVICLTVGGIIWAAIKVKEIRIGLLAIGAVVLLVVVLILIAWSIKTIFNIS